MTPPKEEISYAAHTASCTFLLDDEGICRRIVIAPGTRHRESALTAAGCVGAQYVASVDSTAAGGLVEMPRVGAALLFARVDDHGRISLVRTSVLTSFESRAGEDPFADSPSVETSAPALGDVAKPRMSHARDLRHSHVPHGEVARRAAPRGRESYRDYETDLNEDEFDRTSVKGHELTTNEYVPPPIPAPPPPRAGSSRSPTLRKPRETLGEGEDRYSRPAAGPSRGAMPRRSDPRVGTAASAARAWAPDSERTPPARGSDVQVTRRRRST